MQRLLIILEVTPPAQPSVDIYIDYILASLVLHTSSQDHYSKGSETNKYSSNSCLLGLS